MQTKKYTFPKIKISLLANFGVSFFENTDFGPKKQFSAERKNGGISVVPARTRSVGHFFMAWTVPLSHNQSGAGLLVVHSMFKEECSYIRPFIVIGT